MWPTSIVMRHPFGEDASEMPFIEGNHPIKTLTTSRSDQSFAVRVRLRRRNRRLQYVQPHRIQRAVERRRVDGVVVVHHESMRGFAGDARAELLHGPVRWRMLRDVPVLKAGRADVEHN